MIATTVKTSRKHCASRIVDVTHSIMGAAVKGRTLWIVDAHRDDGKRFVVHADEKLTAFMELESPCRAAANFS